MGLKVASVDELIEKSEGNGHRYFHILPVVYVNSGSGFLGLMDWSSYLKPEYGVLQITSSSTPRWENEIYLKIERPFEMFSDEVNKAFKKIRKIKGAKIYPNRP